MPAKSTVESGKVWERKNKEIRMQRERRMGRQALIGFFLFNYCIFTMYSRYIKRVISKRDGYEYLKQVPSSDGSLELI
jgi:hypothetical protein